MLLKEKPDLSIFDKEGKSCLHHAVQSRSEDLVLLLLKNGVSANISQKSHKTPLQLAVRNGDDVIAGILLAYKADFKKNAISQQSLLHLAVESRNNLLVETLLKLNLNVDSVTSAGVTPLMQAAFSSNPHICQLLIDHRASLNLLSKHQEETAVSMAIYYGMEDNARVLVSEGACLTLEDKRSVVKYHSKKKLKLDSLKSYMVCSVFKLKNLSCFISKTYFVQIVSISTPIFQHLIS